MRNDSDMAVARWETVPEELPEEVVRLIPPELAFKHGVVPRGRYGNTLECFALESEQVDLAELAFVLECDVVLVEGEPRRIRHLLEKYWSEKETKTGGSEAEPAKEELALLAEQAPVVELVNAVFLQAVKAKASDIHFEPFEDFFRIRCRVDGTLLELPSPRRELALAVISRIKVLAQLDIAERRVPQDGRIRMTLDGHAVDLRVSTLPTQFGESVVLRVLDQAAVKLSLEQLGMPETVMAGVRRRCGGRAVFLL